MKNSSTIAVAFALAGCAAVPDSGLTACRAAMAMPVDRGGASFVDPDRTVDLWTRCMDSEPRAAPLLPHALKIRSIALAQLGQYQAAIDDLEKSQRLAPPKTAWDYIILASYFRSAGQPDKALELLRRMQADRMGMTGVGTVPGMPIYYHLGWTLSELKQWPEAIEAFSEGLKYQPDYGWAHLRRGLAYDAQGDRVHAGKDIDRGLELLKLAVKGSSDLALIDASLSKAPFKELLLRYGHDGARARVL